MPKRDYTAEFQRERLHNAAQDGDLERVEHLLGAKYAVNRFDSLGKTPLHYAADHEHFALVDALLAAGANVNAHDERVIGNTPLRDCIETCSPAMVERLLRAGADPTIPGWMQITATDAAMQRKDVHRDKILKLPGVSKKQRMRR
jgi:ankyrin repeat protein